MFYKVQFVRTISDLQAAFLILFQRKLCAANLWARRQIMVAVPSRQNNYHDDTQIVLTNPPGLWTL